MFVVLSLALLTVSLGLVFLAGQQLYRCVKRLGATASRTQERIAPLVRELGEESALAASESERLQARMSRWSAGTPRRSPRRA